MKCGCEKDVFACSESHAKQMNAVVYCGDCLYPLNECGHFQS